MLVHQTLSLSECDIKFASFEGTFSGYGSVFGNVDSKNDIVAPGAYAEVLKSGEKIPVYVNHGWLDGKLPVGSWSGLKEDDRGLFGDASLKSDKTIPMNAQCTVFAESEVVSLIHSATPKNDIAKAVLDAVASRVCAMVRRVGIEGEVVLIGGMVHNTGFVQSLKTAMGVDAISLPDMPEYISALGCAMIAAERQH